MTEYEVVNGWLVERVGHHTCAAGDLGYLHEPTCGMLPLGKVEDILASSDERVWDILAALIDDDRCMYDHNLWCQTHHPGTVKGSDRCPHELARPLLAEREAVRE